MSNKNAATLPERLDVKKLVEELEVPFPSDQVRWRVTNTTNDKKRGQIMPYADPRAYTDRLNALFSPQGWTRDYKIETMNNIARVKKGETIVSGKVLVTCTVTIIGLWSHSGTGEDWADDDNGMTSADAQAFKRACSCFGLGRYFYDFPVFWVDLDQNRQPARTPVLSGWALPENWRKGMRPLSRNGTVAASNATNGKSHANGSKSPTVTGNGHTATGNTTPGANAANGNDLDARISQMEEAVGTGFYRNILREYGRVNQPKLIRDPAVKRKVFQMLESVTRGFDRLDAVTKRLDPKTVAALLAKLQAPPLDEISDMKTLQHVVFGLEELAGSNRHHAA